jgi:hypothetical protein
MPLDRQSHEGMDELHFIWTICAIHVELESATGRIGSIRIGTSGWG